MNVTVWHPAPFSPSQQFADFVGFLHKSADTDFLKILQSFNRKHSRDHRAHTLSRRFPKLRAILPVQRPERIKAEASALDRDDLGPMDFPKIRSANSLNVTVRP